MMPVGQEKFIDTDGHLHDEMPEETEGGLERLLKRLGYKGVALLEDALGLTIPAPFAHHAPIY